VEGAVPRLPQRVRLVLSVLLQVDLIRLAAFGFLSLVKLVLRVRLLQTARSRLSRKAVLVFWCQVGLVAVTELRRVETRLRELRAIRLLSQAAQVRQVLRGTQAMDLTKS